MVAGWAETWSSLPAWGVWIEISPLSYVTPPELSLPAWGVWIEMGATIVRTNSAPRSLPAWGVWIEI